MGKQSCKVVPQFGIAKLVVYDFNDCLWFMVDISILLCVIKQQTSLGGGTLGSPQPKTMETRGEQCFLMEKIGVKAHGKLVAS